ncbi:MAG: tetratricopeptide repeat protein, partial [Candidatus Krumholzibacteriia bacterium]
MRSPRTLPWRDLWPAALLLLPVLLAYGQVGGFGFVNFDDDAYVQQNPRVLEGPTAANLLWALVTGHQGVWIPTTWISLQLDAGLCGPAPGCFHRTNLVLHLVNALLVYALVLALTGGRWRALAVAAVFAAHPLNAEAVCWVTARKDLVLAAWSLAALLCWRRARASWRGGWAWVALACALAAMAAKPQGVVLPAALVLVSAWPRGADRHASRSAIRELVAVLPFLAVAAAVAWAAFTLARSAEFGELTPVPVAQRVADAPALVWRTALKLVRPAPLAPAYPADGLHVSGAWGGALLLAVLAVLAEGWRRRRRFPALLFGWSWFLAWLLPTLGLVQGGHLPLGDRYAYLALVGLVFVVAEAAVGAAARRPRLRAPLAALLVAVVALGVLQSRRQAAVWRDPVDLWRHTLAVTSDNALAHQNLAVVLDDRGRPAEAWPHLQAALALDPTSRTHYNAGNVLLALGRRAEAEQQYLRALARNPGLVEASLNLGALLGQ